MNKKINLREMQEIELLILKYVHDICEENQLDYYMCGGTLLGAVRHKGFIPWDDDIDIFMFREDYMKLLEILRNTSHDLFEMMSFYDNKDYYYPFAKVTHKQTTLIETDVPKIDGLGIYIDIFPIDGLPNQEKSRKLYFKKILFYRRLLNYSISYKSQSKKKEIMKYPIWLLLNGLGYKNILKLIDRMAMEYKVIDSNNVACSVAGENIEKKMPLEVFCKKIKMKFEDYEFYAPIGYTVHLSNLYGDYMKLPPKEKRVTHHNNICFWNS